MKQKHTITLLISALILALPLSAAWELVDDFEGDPASPKFTFIVDSGDRASPAFNYLPDPQDATNTVIWIDPVTYGTAWTIVFAHWPLSTPIAENSTGTYYLRGYSTDANSTGPVVGLTDIAVEIDPGTGEPIQPTGWGSYESALSLHAGAFKARDSGNYVTTDFVQPVGAWTEVWAVVTNNVGSSDDVTKFYVKGPGDAEPVHVPIPDGNGGYFEDALFRNGTTDDLTGFMYGILAGDPTTPRSGLPYYIDDVFVDPTGENLTSPGTSSGVEKWGQYEVVFIDGKWVDTGDWLGWLALLNSGGNGDQWVWSSTMNSYFYFPSPPMAGSNGSWIYVLKP